MIIALVSLLIAFSITAPAYWFFTRRSQSSDATRVRRRLGVETAADRLAVTGGPSLIRTPAETQGWMNRLGAQFRINDKLQMLIESAASQYSVERVQKECIIFALLAAGVDLVAGNQWTVALSIPVAFLGMMIPILRLRRAARRRLAKFESQFPGALEFIARSMRAGHAFSISLEMLHHESEQPVAGEFRRVFEEQNLGMPLDVALTRLAARIHLIDVQFFVSAVLLQRKTGGNLTEILDTLAEVIRERYKLKGKINAISAHGRITSRALSAIPIVVGAMMFFVNKEYSNFFFHTVTGMEMLAASACLQVLAYVVIGRIVTIEV